MTEGEIIDIFIIRAFFAFFVHASNFASYSSIPAAVAVSAASAV
jgi:hypothetical protein